MKNKAAHTAMMRKARQLKREGRISALDTFERLYRQYRNERLQLVALMTYDGGTGRPPIPRERGDETALVNGSEVRAAARWMASERERWACRSITVSSRRQGERGSVAAIAAAEGAGREWHEFVASRGERTPKGSRKVKVSASRADVDKRLMSQMASIHS